MVVHGSTDIEEQQDLHLVMALRLKLEIEQSRVVRRRPDGAGHVELVGLALAGKAP